MSAELDLRELPTQVHGQRDVGWWGTMGFIFIEGTTLILTSMSLLYLRRNFPQWPPPGTARPDLLIPSINLVLLLSTMIPMIAVGRASRREDVAAVRRNLVIATVLTLGVLVLRGFEFAAINTRWDSDAYGSVLWTALGLHTSLILMGWLETLFLTILFFTGPLEHKHLVDAGHNALYSMFLPLIWIPMFVLVFLWAGWP